MQYNVGVTQPTKLNLAMQEKAPDNEIDYSALQAFVGGGLSQGNYDGEKFIGGFGETIIYNIDYWTLRKRSEQVFNDNLYARGLIQRLITNEINTGLTPELLPDQDIVKVSEDELDTWAELMENRWAIWGRAPELCDWKGADTFGALQQKARREALICGDVLVVQRYNKKTKLPCIQLISGSKVQSPPNEPSLGGRIVHGVELDVNGKEVAFWVAQDDGTFMRLKAVGERSGKRIAWLMYGTEKRLDEVRGRPLLAIVLQSLKEIDRYRDSAQRKAVINSILAMFIKKTEDKMGTLPMGNAAVRKGSMPVVENGQVGPRTFGITDHVPGVVLQELQHGEGPVGFHSQGTDINFPVFETAVISAIAWANEIPPEILTLSFSSNYSASQAAINEFKIYLNKKWGEFGDMFCQPIFVEWLMCEVLAGRTNPAGFFESWNNPEKYDVFGAWTSVEWYGSIKPSTDTYKQARGSRILVENGWSTNHREARNLTGSKYSKNVKEVRRENLKLAEALRPIYELKKEFGLTGRQVAAMLGQEFSAELNPAEDDES